MAKAGNKVFVEITNKDIFDRVGEVIEHVKETNGKVRLHRKWLYGLSTLILALLTWALSVGGK